MRNHTPRICSITKTVKFPHGYVCKHRRPNKDCRNKHHCTIATEKGYKDYLKFLESVNDAPLSQIKVN